MSDRVFDPSQGHAHHLPPVDGVVYTQDGYTFNAGGECLGKAGQKPVAKAPVPETVAENPPPEPAEESEGDDSPPEVTETHESNQGPAENSDDAEPVDYESMTFKELRDLVKEKTGTNPRSRDNAMTLLRGLAD